jgi:myo-inositol-1(or 4)-monophosphatase
MTAIDFAAFVDELATASGEKILPFFRTALGVENKGGIERFDPVTAADRGAEAVIRDLIKKNFPEHGIIGEEFGNERADAEYVWVIDPLDGTRAFIIGYPIWGTLIALTRFGEAIFGMMHQPFMRERFTGDRQAAKYRGPAGERALQVRSCASLSNAVMLTTSPLQFKAPERARFHKVEEKVRLSRYGGDCYAYCMLAAGHADLVIESELNPFDIVALIPIVAGAGGIITTWDGKPAEAGGRIIAAGDKRVHAAALEILNSR